MTKAEESRRGHLRRRYGITPEQYDELFTKQEGICPVCLRHQDEFATRLVIDHDHSTNEIRGLLCAYCNHRVVGRHRDAALIYRMAKYLEGGTGWFVPEKKKTTKSRRTKPPIT